MRRSHQSGTGVPPVLEGRSGVSPLPSVFALVAAVFLSACAHTPPPAQVVKLAVLDGYTMFEVAKGDELTSEGWWFGQRDVLQTNNAGVLASEALAREFAKIPGVEVYSRSDMIVYLASKERLVRKAYPKLSPADRTELLAKQSAVDYGRSLGVDYVLVPRVDSAATVQHGVTSVWTGRAEMEVDLWRTDSGEMIWSWRGKDRDYWDSEFRIIEELSKKAANKARSKRVFE